MASSKVKDSITSLGYLTTSEEEDVITPPVSPVKKFVPSSISPAASAVKVFRHQR
jgi:hypothetical protein